MILDTSFEYTIRTEKSYILMELRGVLNEQGMKEATGALLALSFEKNIRRVLYDATNMKQSDSARKASARYFKQASQSMEKMASYLPDMRIYSLAVFLSLLVSTKNWKPFRTREKAVAWLEQ